MSDFKYDQSARIKDVYIELPKFEEIHRGINNENKILGRDDLLNRLAEQLDDKKTRSRAILVTGFRGVGKTTLIDEALRRKFEKDNKGKDVYSDDKCSSIKISLAQENLTYRHLLRSMVKKMIQKERKTQYYKGVRLLYRCSGFLTLLTVLALLLGVILEQTIFGNNCKYCAFDKIPLIVYVVPFLGVLFFLILLFIKKTGYLNSLLKLEERIDAAVVRENGGDITGGVEALGVKISRRKSSHYPIASDKEIEFDLLAILNHDNRTELDKLFRKRKNPIFVLDELDKIEVRTSVAVSEEPDSQTIYTESEGSIYTTQAIRKRQEAIAGILANMKSFLSEAPARFIFIAGREMYDASLADIAARDSFYGSIFNDIIYVPSLLKSDVSEPPYTGLGGTTERFVARLLFPEIFSKKVKEGVILRLDQTLSDLKSLKVKIKCKVNCKDRGGWLVRYLRNAKSKISNVRIKKKVHCFNLDLDEIIADIQNRHSVLIELKIKGQGLEQQIEQGIHSNKKDINSLFEIVQNQVNLIELYRDEILMIQTPSKKLSEYYKIYLKNHSSLAKGKSYTRELKRRKIIYTLQDFVLYLVYRSNGMPKKIKQLIEEHVIFKNVVDIDPDKNLVVYSPNSPERERYFLKITHKTQHKIGFINYLYRPYLVAHGRSSKFRSDKLLVSTSFLVDHLLKFHNQGFSWRNLELTPEILAINKEPELRRFIARLMESLFKTHLRKIENGIHQYKFHARLEHEIRYLSNIFEADAAAYNFTLDESVLIKKHYKAKINQQRKNYDKRVQENHVQSIAFVNSLLGDLHFFDKEYDDALVNYEDTIQSLVDKGIHKLSLKEFTFYARTQLKIGLTFDRIKAYNTALSTYLELQNQILSFSKRLNKYEFPMGKVHDQTFPLSEQAQGEIKIFSQAFLSSLESTEKAAFDGLTARHLANNFEAFDKWIKICGRLSEQDDNQFSFIKANYFTNRGNILFYKNGNIHLPLELQSKSQTLKQPFLCLAKYKSDVESSYNYYCYPEGIDKLDLPPKAHSFTKDDVYYKPPISALIDYTEALSFYLEILEKIHPNKSSSPLSIELILDLLNPINRHEKTQYSGIGSDFISSLASLISKIGDCMLAFIFEQNAYSTTTVKESSKLMKDMMLEDYFQIQRFKFLEATLLHYSLRSTVPKKKLRGNLNFHNLFDRVNQTHIIQLYELAAHLYDLVERDVNSSFQRRKILFVLNTLKWKSAKVKRLEFMKNVETSVFQKIMGAKYKTHEYTARPQILKYELIFNPSKIFYTTYEDSKNIYNNISTALEAKETVILFSSLAAKLSPYNLAVADQFKEYETNPFDSTPSAYVRYLELRNHLKNGFRKYKKENVKGKDIFVFTEMEDYEFHVICDSIFAAHTLIKLLKVHGRSALFNHSVQAEIHYFMAFWCAKLKEKITPNKELIEVEFKRYKKTLEQLIGGGIIHRLDPNHHYEKAREHYLLTISTHHQGEAYKTLIDHMHYLEDDYADNFSHFGLALERFHINSGAIRKRIQEIEKELKESKFTTYDRYTNENPNGSQ